MFIELLNSIAWYKAFSFAVLVVLPRIFFQKLISFFRINFSLFFIKMTWQSSKFRE